MTNLMFPGEGYVGSVDGISYDVDVDILAGMYGGTQPKRRSQHVQGIKALKATEGNFAFDFPAHKISVEAERPDVAMGFTPAVQIAYLTKKEAFYQIPFSGRILYRRKSEKIIVVDIKLPEKKVVKLEKRKFDLVVDIQENMAQNKVLKTHIINYAKTRETYIEYRKSDYSKKFYEAHRDEIILHKAAKEAKCGILLCCTADMESGARPEKKRQQ